MFAKVKINVERECEKCSDLRTQAEKIQEALELQTKRVSAWNNYDDYNFGDENRYRKRLLDHYSAKKQK